MLTKLIYNYLSSRPYERVWIRYRGHAIRAEVADSFAKQLIGLMYRESIGKNEGMLFPVRFEGTYAAGVVMYNMRFGIDIVWLDSKRRIVDVFRGAEPCRSFFNCKTYVPKSKAKYVIELGAGTASRLRMGKGEKITWNWR